MNIDFGEGMRRIGLSLGFIGGIAGVVMAAEVGRPAWIEYSAHRKFESLLATPTMQRLTKAMNEPLRIVKSEPLPTGGDWFSKHAPSGESVQGPPTGSDRRAAYADGHAPPITSASRTSTSTHADYGSLAREHGETESPSRSAQDNPYAIVSSKPLPSHAPPQTSPRQFQAINIPGEGYLEFPASMSDADIASAIKAHLAARWETIQQPDGLGGLYLLNTHPLLKGNTDGIDSVRFDASNSITSIGLSSGQAVQRTEAPSTWAILTPVFYPALGFAIPWGIVRIVVWVVLGFFPPRP